LTVRSRRPHPTKLGVATAALLAGLLLPLAAAEQAEARILDLRVGGRAGGMIGWGSTDGTPDFFDTARGGVMGVEVGAKIFVLDLSVNFAQVINTDGRAGTLSQALLGFEIDVPIARGSTAARRARLILRPGINGGFGFGTPGPVKPPLSNDQISNKGFVTHLKVGLEHFLHPLVGIGVEGWFGYHYFLGGSVVNDSKSYSSGYHLLGLGTLTFHLGI
jgi:hypothetical protein